MQVLTPNSVFKLIGDESAGDYPSGLYRVVFNEPVNKEVVVVCLDVIDGARRSDPSTSALTLKEFAQVLHIIFSTYNLTADRSNRLDAHMWAQNVAPSPSGLWRWGHQMGIGFGHTHVFSELGTRLLHKGQGWVNRSSVRFSGLDFMSDFVKSAQWTSIARAQGGWDIPVFLSSCFSQSGLDTTSNRFWLAGVGALRPG
jgi:hypothetical protein